MPKINKEKTPQEFICPITYDIMMDPVSVITGQTYEREEIEKWLSSNDTDPMTNLKLDSKILIPNYALKSMIEKWQRGSFEENQKASTHQAEAKSSPLKKELSTSLSFAKNPASHLSSLGLYKNIKNDSKNTIRNISDFINASEQGILRNGYLDLVSSEWRKELEKITIYIDKNGMNEEECKRYFGINNQMLDQFNNTFLHGIAMISHTSDQNFLNNKSISQHIHNAIKCGCDINTKNDLGYTAYELAIKIKKNNLAELLKDYELSLALKISTPC